jgi:glutaredoxin 3
MFATRYCGYCARARALLESKGLPYKEILVDGDLAERRRMEALSGRRTVPQIFIDERSVGGFTDLAALDHAGQLDALVYAAAEDRPLDDIGETPSGQAG